MKNIIIKTYQKISKMQGSKTFVFAKPTFSQRFGPKKSANILPLRHGSVYMGPPLLYPPYLTGSDAFDFNPRPVLDEIGNWMVTSFNSFQNIIGFNRH